MWDDEAGSLRCGKGDFSKESEIIDGLHMQNQSS
jgi:hypothetical protein